MGGQIPLMFDSIVTSRPLANGGRVRMLAVADKSRLPDFPNVPTMAEAGYPEVNFSNWSGVIASSRMSPELAGKLHAVLQKIAANPAFKDRLVAAGLQPTAPRTLEQAASEVRQEHARNAEIVKTYGIKMD